MRSPNAKHAKQDAKQVRVLEKKRQRGCISDSRNRGRRAVEAFHERRQWYRAVSMEAALLADGAALVFNFGIAGARRIALHVVRESGIAVGRFPGGNIPDNTSEAAQLEALFLPFAALELACAVESAQPGVDSTLVCLGTKLLDRGRASEGGLVVGIVDYVTTVDS